MKPELECIEVEPVWGRNHDLTVKYAVLRKIGEKRVAKLGEVPIERSKIPAPDEDVAAAAKHDRSKAIPLRLVQERAAGRQRRRDLGEHRLNRRSDGKRRAHDRLRPSTRVAVFGSFLSVRQVG